jgi:hypothetical protein
MNLKSTLPLISMCIGKEWKWNGNGLEMLVLGEYIFGIED